MSDIPETGRRSHDSILKTTTTWGLRLARLTLITLLAAGLSFADGKKHKLSKDFDGLKGGRNGAVVDVIIQFNQAPTEAHHQKVHDKEIGRASCRERVEIWVDAVTIKKKKK